MQCKRNISSKSKRTLLSFFLCFFVMPLTLWLGTKFGDRQYYLVGLLLILYAMLPFFLLFERKKPQARELVILSVMCTIAILSRIIFIWIPHFKPLTAIVMITGIAFGAEAGFLTGAVSAFVSNFFFGQGPWTPWQMFAFGMAGFITGLVFRKGILPKNPLPLSIFGAVLVMILVGPILDTSTLLTMTSVIRPESALAIYASGIPINAIHALATALTLFFVSAPLFEKLDRIKLKYGMMEGAA
ncbi:MAG: ECF transporter S component [Oscillospiraceae bacterium]